MDRRNSHPKYQQFRFDAGSLSLNFVATVRHRGSQPRDLLSSPEMLLKWLHLVGLFIPDIPPSLKDYEKALVLRETIHDAVQAIIMDERPSKSAIELINDAAEYPLPVPRLQVTADSVTWETKHPLKACLAVIARDAIMIIGEESRDRLKMCSGNSCRMLFMDTSPSNRRRWCAMSICGNRHKVSIHRQKGMEPSIKQSNKKVIGG